MENESRVFGKFVWLVIVLSLFAYLYLFQYDGNIGKEYFTTQETTTNQQNTTIGQKTQFVEISSSNKVSSNSRNVVSKRTNENLDGSEDIIVFDNGEAVIVKNGAVIYDGKLIVADNDNSEVRYLDTPMRVITVN